MVCETKLHINTVTSDILRALSKNELRVEARERRIQQVQIEQSEASNRVAIERRKLNEVNAENKLKTDNMIFKTQQQETKIRKCDEDNAQIQRHIDLRRMEKEIRRPKRRQCLSSQPPRLLSPRYDHSTLSESGGATLPSRG